MKKQRKENKAVSITALVITIALLISIILIVLTLMQNGALLNERKAMEQKLGTVEKKEEMNLSNKHYKSKDEGANFEELCFVAGTKVITPEGYANIEDLKIGDSVYSRNEETGKTEIKKIVQVYKRDYEMDTLNISTHYANVESTLNHKFYEKSKGWIEAEKLNKGDILINNNNEEIEIIVINRIKNQRKQKVYNLEVEDNHNYFVGLDCVLVHNHCCVIGDTLVQTNLSGETKLIKNIKVGDQIVTRNLKTGENELQTVKTTTIKENVREIAVITFEDGTQITQNLYHEMYTKQGWKAPVGLREYDTLEEEDTVETEDGWKKIKTIEINLNHEPINLYTLNDESNHSFYANGTLMKGY